jgi:hypothetical protein
MREMFEQDYVESKVDFNELCRRQYTWRSVP